MKHMIDLHTHTNYSDGALSPKDLVTLAKEKGLKAMAVTDHDTARGLDECIRFNSGSGLEIIPGAEIGIKNEESRGLTEIHILGYFIDCENRKLLSVFEKISQSKRNWLVKQIKKLNEIGIDVSSEDVKRTAKLAVPSRPHIWRTIEMHGNGVSVWHRTEGSGSAGTKVPCENNGSKISRDDFFNRTRTGGDLFVRRDFGLPLEDCIRLIHEAGGIAVFAHPGFHDFENVVKLCVDAGIDGIEVKYFYDDFGIRKSREIVRKINCLAEKHSLLKTGGSDFHSKYHGAMLGSVSVPYEYLEKMKERIQK